MAERVGVRIVELMLLLLVVAIVVLVLVLNLVHVVWMMMMMSRVRVLRTESEIVDHFRIGQNFATLLEHSYLQLIIISRVPNRSSYYWTRQVAHIFGKEFVPTCVKVSAFSKWHCKSRL